MDAFHDRCNPKEYVLTLVNSVKIYLRVLTLADVTNLEGTEISTWARIGESPRSSSLEWPIQSKPSMEAVCLWRRFLSQAFSNRTNTRTNRCTTIPLKTPLGRWVCPPHIHHNHYWTPSHLYARRPQGTFNKHTPY